MGRATTQEEMRGAVVVVVVVVLAEDDTDTILRTAGANARDAAGNMIATIRAAIRSEKDLMDSLTKLS